MSLEFIGANPAVTAYDQGMEANYRQRKQRQEQDVDTAVRGGVSDMLSQRQQMAPQPGQLRDLNADPTNPQPQPGQQLAGPPQPNVDPISVAPVASSAPPGIPPTRGPSTAIDGARLQDDPLGASIANVERGSGIINAGGYAGKYQFGTAALHAAGAYQPAQGENLRSNEWRGNVTLPGRGAMTVQQFANDDGAQDQAWQMHTANLDREIANRGLDRFIGQTVGGVPITHSSLISLMQFGGPRGTQQYLESGGRLNPSDGNLRMSEYATRVAANGGGVGGVSAPMAVSPGAAAAAAGALNLGLGGGAVPQQTGTRYDPILNRLAQTPGGGATALQLLVQQRQYDQAGLNRQTQYQRLAMQALGRGDADVFKYYAQLGGINLPPEVMQNAGIAKRLATASLLAERFYKDDPQAGTRLVQGYVQTGDIGQAFQMAGPPRDNPRLQLTWLRQGEQELAMSFNPRNNQMQPVVGPDQQPVTRDMRPTAGQSRPTWVTQPDGTQLAFQPHPDGTMTPFNGPDGQQMRQAPGAGRGRVADRTIRLQMLKAAGYSDQEANAIAAGVGVTGNVIATTRARFRATIEKNQPLTGDTPDAMEKKTDIAMDAMFGPDWRGRMTGQPAGGAPAAPAPQLPPAQTEPLPQQAPSGGQPAPGLGVDTNTGNPAPQAAPQQAASPAPTAAQPAPLPHRPQTVPPGSVYSPSRRMWRDPQGNLYDEQGNRSQPAAQPAAAPSVQTGY